MGGRLVSIGQRVQMVFQYMRAIVYYGVVVLSSLQPSTCRRRRRRRRRCSLQFMNSTCAVIKSVLLSAV